MQALLDLESRHRQVEFIRGENTSTKATSLDQREASSLCITLAICARDHFLCYRTLRCKCPNLWVEDYRTVPRV